MNIPSGLKFILLENTKKNCYGYKLHFNIKNTHFTLVEPSDYVLSEINREILNENCTCRRFCIG